MGRYGTTSFIRRSGIRRMGMGGGGLPALSGLATWSSGRDCTGLDRCRPCTLSISISLHMRPDQDLDLLRFQSLYSAHISDESNEVSSSPP